MILKFKGLELCI
jgi:hypothetical protein